MRLGAYKGRERAHVALYKSQRHASKNKPQRGGKNVPILRHWPKRKLV